MSKRYELPDAAWDLVAYISLKPAVVDARKRTITSCSTECSYCAAPMVCRCAFYSPADRRATLRMPNLYWMRLIPPICLTAPENAADGCWPTRVNDADVLRR